MDAFSGSVELITADSESLGVPGVLWTPDVVPVIVGALHGVTDMAPIEPEPQPTGRTPDAAWSGKDRSGRDVAVYLWRDQPYDQTAVAQAIAQAIAEKEGR